MITYIDMSSKFSYPQLVHPLVERINKAAQCSMSKNGFVPVFEADMARRDLIAAAEQLLIAARSPEENVIAIAQQVYSRLVFRLFKVLFAPQTL